MAKMTVLYQLSQVSSDTIIGEVDFTESLWTKDFALRVAYAHWLSCNEGIDPVMSFDTWQEELDPSVICIITKPVWLYKQD